jgi:hypothetical protein
MCLVYKELFFICRYEEQNNQWEKRIKQKEAEKNELQDRLEKVGTDYRESVPVCRWYLHVNFWDCVLLQYIMGLSCKI